MMIHLNTNNKTNNNIRRPNVVERVGGTPLVFTIFSDATTRYYQANSIGLHLVASRSVAVEGLGLWLMIRGCSL